MMEQTEQELNAQKSLADAKAVSDTLLIYKNMYPQSKLDDNGIFLYSISLVQEGYSFSEIKTAMDKLVRTKTFFPSLAEIIETIESLEKTVIGNDVKDFDEAWEEVYKEVKRCFIYTPPQFSSQEIEETVNKIGWDTLCNMQSDSVSTVRAQFERFYKMAVSRKKEREQNMLVLHRAGNDTVRLIADRLAKRKSMIKELDKLNPSEKVKGLLEGTD